MENSGVLIIGGGAAGLSAALELSSAGRKVVLLEARNRLGGRVHTIRTKVGNLPVELGAEFVHGNQNEAWQVLRAAELATMEVPDCHWRNAGDEFTEFPFWKELESVTGALRDCSIDEPFASFLEGHPGLSAESSRLAREYVEGFHAADAKRMGVQAIQRAENAAEKNGGTKQFRVMTGYSGVMDWLHEAIKRNQVAIHCQTVVKRVNWEPGHVECVADTPDGPRSFEGVAALVTLPLGILKEQSGASSVVFNPPLSEKREAIDGLAVGKVVKVTLHFSSRFWQVENFGFIHHESGMFPTWWSDERGNLLTGWAGSRQAAELGDGGVDRTLAMAVAAASEVFRTDAGKVKDLLLGAYTYDWSQDVFSRGAYSYTPAGMIEMPEFLAAPVAGTLFFAGEATDAHGDQGTVHGALASGKRAAGEIIETVS